jgi:di- and tripeptidase
MTIGCQNTSIQFLECSQLQSGEPLESNRFEDVTPSTPPLGSLPKKSKVHKFFNSYPQYERKPADELAVNIRRPPQLNLNDGNGCVSDASANILPITLDIPVENVIDSAHYGYVYCMVPIPSIRDGSDDAKANRFSRHLVTGSGDETLKVHTCAS